jgi:hypothetical protein
MVARHEASAGPTRIPDGPNLKRNSAVDGELVFGQFLRDDGSEGIEKWLAGCPFFPTTPEHVPRTTEWSASLHQRSVPSAGSGPAAGFSSIPRCLLQSGLLQSGLLQSGCRRTGRSRGSADRRSRKSGGRFQEWTASGEYRPQARSKTAKVGRADSEVPHVPHGASRGKK